MLGRAASLQAGRKENRWPAGGRGSRVRPHSGLDPDLYFRAQVLQLQRSHLGSQNILGESSYRFRESMEIREGGELRVGRKRA